MGFLWSKKGRYRFFLLLLLCRDIFYASSSFLLSSKMTATGKNRRRQKPHTVWRWFLPYEPSALDGLAHIRPPLPSAVVAWLRCSFTAVSFSDGCFFFLRLFACSFFTHNNTNNTRTVWKKKKCWALEQKGNACLVFWVFCGRAREHTAKRPQEARWMQLLLLLACFQSDLITLYL